MNTFIGNAKGEELTGVAAALRGEEAQGVPELSTSGGGARCSGERWFVRSGVGRWRSSLRGGGGVAGEREKGEESGEEEDMGGPAPLFMELRACGFRIYLVRLP